MEDKITNIKERILYIAEFKGVSKEKFFEDLGLTYGNFKGKSKNTPINSNSLVDILTNYPDVNIEWLLMGTGQMLRNEEYSALANKNLTADEPNEKYDSEYWKNEYIAALKECREIEKKYTALLEDRYFGDKSPKAG